MRVLFEDKLYQPNQSTWCQENALKYSGSLLPPFNLPNTIPSLNIKSMHLESEFELEQVRWSLNIDDVSNIYPARTSVVPKTSRKGSRSLFWVESEWFHMRFKLDNTLAFFSMSLGSLLAVQNYPAVPTLSPSFLGHPVINRVLPQIHNSFELVEWFVILWSDYYASVSCTMYHWICDLCFPITLDPLLG